MASSARKRRERRLEAARGYLMLDMPQHALRELEAISDPHRCIFPLNQLRGEALRHSGDYDTALTAYDRALQERPADLSVLLGIADCYRHTDRLSRAVSALQQAYRADPQQPVVMYRLACCYAQLGQKSQALSWLGRALRMDASLRALLPRDPDFDHLRHDPDFQFIVAAVQMSER